jgi:hypothetical protein
MNVAKTQTVAAPVRPERTDVAQKPKVNPAQQDQQKAQAQAKANEARKAQEVQAGGVKKGGEINITA